MIRILSLTDAGSVLAQRLLKTVPKVLPEKMARAATSGDNGSVQHHHKPSPFSQSVQQFFAQGDPIILICAMGIAVRALAPVIQSKHSDPPVLVMDELGQFVVPLLSGHEGGANHWAYQLSRSLHAQAVITTANAYVEPVYTVGMGCERHCPEGTLRELLFDCLNQVGLTQAHIQSIHSIDIKADEVGLIELANYLNKPYQTWSVQNLKTQEHLLSTKSEYVFNTVGVYGVAESAALYGASCITDHAAELVLAKQKNAKATCAIARSYSKHQIDSSLLG